MLKVYGWRIFLFFLVEPSIRSVVVHLGVLLLISNKEKSVDIPPQKMRRRDREVNVIGHVSGLVIALLELPLQ